MSDGREQYADSAFNKAAEAAMEEYRKKAAGLQPIADNMAALGAELGMLAGQFAVAPPRNQYEPLFPQGAAIGSPPRPFGGTLTGAGTTLNAITNPLQEQKRQERDPNGVDPHTPGAKMDAGKTPLRKGALEQFPRALMAVADVSAFGAAKYTWGGWQTVPDGVQRYLDAGARHAALRAMGELIDKDSGLSHLAQEAWNILAALELALRKAHDYI